MKTYAKLIDGSRLEFAPCVFKKEKMMIIGYNMNSNEDMLFEDGYKVLIDCPKPNDEKVYDEYFKEDKLTITRQWKEHHYSDLEIETLRNQLYENLTDKILARVQRGAANPKDYIAAVARIKFEHKYSYEINLLYQDYYNEAARLWNEANPERLVEFLSEAA